MVYNIILDALAAFACLISIWLCVNLYQGVQLCKRLGGFSSNDFDITALATDSTNNRTNSNK